MIDDQKRMTEQELLALAAQLSEESGNEFMFLAQIILQALTKKSKSSVVVLATLEAVPYVVTRCINSPMENTIRMLDFVADTLAEAMEETEETDEAEEELPALVQDSRVLH